MSWAFLKPKKPAWLAASGGVAVVTLAFWALVSWLSPWQPGRFWGLTFGTLAALVFVLLALYPLRRRLLSWPLGNAQRWLQFHVYGGVLACLFVFVHMGFRWPAGTMGWWLVALVLLSTVSGLLGVFLQKWVPTLVTGNLSVEAIYERIPEMSARLAEEADEALEGCSEQLEQVYQAEIRPLLATPAPSWEYLVNLRSGQDRRMAPLNDIAPFVEDDDRERLADLEAIVREKFELDAHYSLQRVLKTWVVLHVPPTMLLLGLMTVHIFAVLIH